MVSKLLFNYACNKDQEIKGLSPLTCLVLKLVFSIFKLSGLSGLKNKTGLGTSVALLLGKLL